MRVVCKYTIILFILMLFFKVGMKIAHAQVIINEIYSWESSGDWIELYAYEDTDISGWVVRDLASTPIKIIPNGTIVGPGYSMFFVIEAGNRLNKDGDVVKLFKGDDTILVDEISYGESGGVCAPGQGQSVGRYPDANSTIERFSEASKNESNNNSVLAPCPTPTTAPSNTPVPTATLRPTYTPTPSANPTKVSTPTLAKTPTPTPIPTKTPNPTQEPDDDRKEALILGSQEVGVGQDLKDEDIKSSPSSKKKYTIPFSAIVLMILGFVFLLLPLFIFFYKKIRYNSESEE